MVPGLRMRISELSYEAAAWARPCFQRTVVAHVELGIDAETRDLVLDAPASVAAVSGCGVRA